MEELKTNPLLIFMGMIASTIIGIIIGYGIATVPQRFGSFKDRRDKLKKKTEDTKDKPQNS